MNTMESPRRDFGLIYEGRLLLFILSNVIWAMDGKINASTMIRLRRESKR